MSVIVKNMEMPKCCIECSCCRHDNWNGETAHQCNVSLITFGAEDENWIYDQRPNWCPLVEIPTPHGNLKDESDIISLIEVMFCKDKDGMEHAIQCVKDAPTVIEAEGSET